VKRGIDIETTSLDPADSEISLMQIYDPEEDAVLVYDMLLGVTPVWNSERKLVFNGTGGSRYVTKPTTGIAHNATFEERWLREKLGAEFDLDDTMIASLVLYTGTNAAHNKQFSHSLAAVAKRELKRDLPKDEQGSDWSARPLTRAQVMYAALDAAILPPLFETLMRKIDDAGLREVYELEKRVARAVDQMERNGFAINESRLHEFIEGTKHEAAQLRKELEDEWDINPGSSKQLREYFGQEGREGWPTTAGGAPKTDQDAMKLLEAEEPAIAKWLQWKKVEKLRSTYGESLRKKVVNRRIHGRFKQFGTATGRFSNADPNLQNFPKDAAVRGMFWSGSEDRVLVKADYSGIELRLAAVLWGEKRMMKLLRNGINLHTATAASIYNMPMDAIGKDSVEAARRQDRELCAPLRRRSEPPPHAARLRRRTHKRAGGLRHLPQVPRHVSGVQSAPLRDPHGLRGGTHQRGAHPHRPEA
jgi:DNA polymerase I